MLSREKRSSVLRWASLAAAIFVLNFALTFHNVWPTLWITTHNELSVEIAVLLLAMTLYTRFVAPLSTRAIAGLGLLLTIMAIGRYAEVTAPALFGRRVNIYWDAQYLPDVAAMLTQTASPWLVAASLAGVALLLVAVYALLEWSLTRVATSVRAAAGRRAVGAVALVLLALYGLGQLHLPIAALRWFSLPVTHTYWQQVEFVATALSGTVSTESLPAAEAPPHANLARLGGADVILMFVESYGAVAYDNEALSTAVTPSREDLAAALAATGREVVSAFVESPTFGGGSWRAHSSLMAGLDIRDDATYNLLLTQDRETLPARFAAAGYRPIALMPGLKNEWPEGAFYSFERIYGERALDYRGPDIGRFWRIPDQYSLAKLDEIERGGTSRRPLFVFFPTISTHMPFRPTPPYDADWHRILSPEPFGADSVAEIHETLPGLTELQAAYADALSYTFAYLGGFLREHPSANMIWVILGDHQPASSVTGPDARLDVPVHIVARDPAILDALIAEGFVPGLVPAEGSIAPMYDLYAILLRAFSD